MSNAVYNRIRGVQIEPTKKAILMALANIADDSGSTKLFAPVERLVYETCFKERTVRDALKQLEQIGAIKIKYRTGMPSTYLINPALSSPARDFGDDDQETFESVDLQSDAGVVQLSAGVSLLNAGVAQLDAPLHLMQKKCSQMQGGGAANAGLMQFNCEKAQSNAPYTPTSFTSSTPTTSAVDFEQEKTAKPKIDHMRHFDQFYTAYPRKIGKENARKAWLKLKVDDDLLLIILAALKNQIAGWTDQKFIPHPATWLNGKRWEDQSVVAASAAQPSQYPPNIPASRAVEVAPMLPPAKLAEPIKANPEAKAQVAAYLESLKAKGIAK